MVVSLSLGPCDILTVYNLLGQNKRLERADEVVAIPQVKVMMLSSSA